MAGVFSQVWTLGRHRFFNLNDNVIKIELQESALNVLNLLNWLKR
jgi:hypothetical protein